MLWGEALNACEALGITAGAPGSAYELSYAYLDAGPDALAEIEATLWEDVARLPAGAELPPELGEKLFAWKNAAYMAGRRRPHDLPPAWSDDAQAKSRRRFRDT